MNRFPDPLTLPEDIVKTRYQRNREVSFAIWLGVFARIGIIVFEMLGFFLFSSSALFLDALSSLFDVLSSFILLVFIKLATRPPDSDHPFGHGRFEPLVGFQLGMIMSCVGFFLMVQQLLSLSVAKDSVHHHLAWTFPLVAMIILEGCYHFARRVGRKQKSSALLVETNHYRIDSISSCFALVALLFASHLPTWYSFIDRLGAIAIALFMIVLGVKSVIENVHELMDRVPDATFFERVRKAAIKVEGVLGTEKLLILRYGPDAHVNIDIEVAPDLSVEKAHLLTQKVRLEIQKEWPAVRDVMVHVEPYYPGDH